MRGVRRLGTATAAVVTWTMFIQPGLSQPTNSTQQTNPPPVQDAAEPRLPEPKAMKPGDLLMGQLNAIRSRGKGRKAAPAYQLVSEPRRLPPPSGLCNLETGPETFQIIPSNDAQAAQLKKLMGKRVSLKVDAVSCAEEAGIMSEAVVTKWSVVQ